jgi:hypothetical protein
MPNHKNHITHCFYYRYFKKYRYVKKKMRETLPKQHMRKQRCYQFDTRRPNKIG